MADWTKSMQQTYEVYKVDPDTWGDKELVENVTSISINRDSSAETLQTATFDVDEDPGECYFRVYLKTIQNGDTERFPLGTFIVQTSSLKFDGKQQTTSLDAYSPLLELKDKPMPLGYTIPFGENIMSLVCTMCQEQMRAPVVSVANSKTMIQNYTADSSETYLEYLANAMAYAKYQFDLDEYSRVLFAPIVTSAQLSPVYTFDDDNSSILEADVTLDRDLYGIPNVVEVIYSNSGRYLEARVVNDNENSPISTVNRGREVIYRETNPSFDAYPDQSVIDDYATNLLESKSTLEYKVTFSHGYYPVRLGDAVRLNYKRAGLENVVAKITAQTINCETGCTIDETAVYTKNLWK